MVVSLAICLPAKRRLLFFVPNRTHRASQEVPDPLWKTRDHARHRLLLSDPRANHPLASSIRSNHFRAKRAILSRSAAKCLAAFVSLGSSYLCSWRRRRRVLIRTQIKTTAASSTANIKNAVSMAVRKKSKQRSFTLHGRTGIASLDNLRSKQVAVRPELTSW